MQLVQMQALCTIAATPEAFRRQPLGILACVCCHAAVGHLRCRSSSKTANAEMPMSI
jgi:hypothetical protein